MKQQVLTNFDLPWLPLIALIIFVVCFGAYFAWAFNKSNKKVFEEISNIPLEEATKAFSGKKGHNV